MSYEYASRWIDGKIQCDRCGEMVSPSSVKGLTIHFSLPKHGGATRLAMCAACAKQAGEILLLTDKLFEEILNFHKTR